MRYVAVYAMALGLVALHGAWKSIELPLLIGVATLVCIIIKNNSKSNEQKEEN